MARVPVMVLLDEAQGLLVQTYNRTELRQLLRSRMDVDLDDITPNATGNKDMVFELLTWMDRRGRVAELIQVAAADRPQVPEWQALLAQATAGPSARPRPAPPQDPPPTRAAPPPGEVVALVRGYDRLRRALPDGDQKTVQLQALVNQLLELPFEEYDMADRFHLSDGGGERLAAVLTLVRRPDTRYLRWLAERVAVEDRFVGYQAAVALEAAAKTLPSPDLDAVMAAVESARGWIPSPERQDKGRWRKLGQALDAITRRSAAGRPPAANI